MSSKNRIKTIGVELEGGWRLGYNFSHIRHDGSVRGLPTSAEYIGETSSSALATQAAIVAWMRLAYPHAVNETCGFHVHIGVNKLNYCRLMERPFFDMFYQRMDLFVRKYAAHPGFDLLAQRLRGDNQYCQKRHLPEQQLFETAPYGNPAVMPRYSALNFCFARHGTLECRVFPCFPDVEDSILGLAQFCEIVNTYLSQCAPEKAVTVSVSEKDIPVIPKPTPTNTKHVLDYRLHRTEAL